MKKIFGKLMLVSMVLTIGLLIGCEWEEADDFNTSQGAGANVNLSGTYMPRAGEILAGTNVTRLVVMQIANVLEISDNNNSKYTGTIGSPGVVAPPDPTTGIYPAGAIMLQSHVYFSGTNSESDESVEFVGTIRAVAVEDVVAVEKTVTISEEEMVKITTTTYTITEANTQYVLEGSWTEGDTTYEVDAFARASTGTF